MTFSYNEDPMKEAKLLQVHRPLFATAQLRLSRCFLAPKDLNLLVLRTPAANPWMDCSGPSPPKHHPWRHHLVARPEALFAYHSLRSTTPHSLLYLLAKQ